MFPLPFRLPPASAFALVVSLGWCLAVRAANTEKYVLANASMLDAPASYQDGTVPGPTGNPTFTNGTYASTAFTLNNTALSIGILRDLDTTQALTISASESLTLNGDSSPGHPLPSDLLYLSSGANLTYGGTGGVVLAANGFIDLAGTAQATFNAAISGPYGLNKSGAGTLTLVGVNAYTGNTLVSGGALAITGGAIGTAGSKATFTMAATGSIPASTLSGTASVNTGAATFGGPGGNAYFVQSGDSFSTNGAQLAVGLDGGGTYGLSGGTLSTGTAYIGGATAGGSGFASGSFNQYGGTFTTNGNPLHIGFAGTGNGDTVQAGYSLFGGLLSTGAATVGDDCAASFDQGGGTFTTNGAPLVIDSNAGNPTMYRFSGVSSVLSTGAMTVGKNGMGFFTQAEGSVTTNGNPLTLAANVGSRGNYSIAYNCTLTVSGIAGGGGQSGFHFAGGTLRAAADATNFLSGLTFVGIGQNLVAVIDTQNHLVTIGQNLVTEAPNGTSDGGLTKLGSGTLTLTGTNTYMGPTVVSAGTLAITAGTTGTTGAGSEFAVYGPAAGNAAATLSAGSLSASQVFIGGPASGALPMVFDGTGTFTQTGGSFTANGHLSIAGGPGNLGINSGIYQLQGGSLSTRTAYVGSDVTGTFTQQGGAFTTNTDLLYIGAKGGYNLDGGVLIVGGIAPGLGGQTAGTFNFNGGTLRAEADGTSFLQGLTVANVRRGGAIIDTGGYNVTVAQALVHDTAASAAATDGGLVKKGIGTLTLSAANTYSGATQINAGTLALSGSGSLGTAGNIGIAAAGTLDVSAISSGYTLSEGRALTSLGMIAGSLTVAGNATYTGGGTISGLLTVQGGGLVTISGGTLTINGGVINNGTIRLRRGATLVIGSGGTFTNNAGATLDIITGSISAPAGFTNNGVIIDSSAIKIKEVNLSGGTLTVGVEGYTDHTYQLHRSDSLVNPSYRKVGTEQTGATGQTLTFTDASATGTQGFYRVQVDP